MNTSEDPIDHTKEASSDQKESALLDDHYPFPRSPEFLRGWGKPDLDFENDSCKDQNLDAEVPEDVQLDPETWGAKKTRILQKAPGYQKAQKCVDLAMCQIDKVVTPIVGCRSSPMRNKVLTYIDRTWCWCCYLFLILLLVNLGVMLLETPKIQAIHVPEPQQLVSLKTSGAIRLPLEVTGHFNRLAYVSMLLDQNGQVVYSWTTQEVDAPEGLGARETSWYLPVVVEPKELSIPSGNYTLVTRVYYPVNPLKTGYIDVDLLKVQIVP